MLDDDDNGPMVLAFILAATVIVAVGIVAVAVMS